MNTMQQQAMDRCGELPEVIFGNEGPAPGVFETMGMLPVSPMSLSVRTTPLPLAQTDPAAARDFTGDFVEHSHPQYGSGYFCTPDVFERIASLADENDRLRAALQFYADGNHFAMHQPDAWDTVSGEPANFYEDESNTATVEDGSVAKMALAAATPAPQHYEVQPDGTTNVVDPDDMPAVSQQAVKMGEREYPPLPDRREGLTRRCGHPVFIAEDLRAYLNADRKARQLAACNFCLEQASAARATLASPSSTAGGWLPIATAPKDGKWFLSWRSFKGGEIRQTKWAADCFGAMHWGGDGWHFDEKSGPTYWMPLPTAPQGAQS